MHLKFTLAIVAVLLYLSSFFPTSTKLSKEARTPLPKTLESYKFKYEELYKAQFNKTVLLIIDALRLDFVSPSNTPNLWNLFNENGCNNNVTVATPTVTLPRIKALTTGSVPQFIDIVLNLGNPGVVEDSLIHSAVRNNKKVVFYGDDIWLRLYKNQFTRSEGVSSLFVNDFTEVDDNVTRNVELELNKDWDFMILHYIGLDHIGHVFGPFSDLIPKKLKEMDRIIHKIYKGTKNTNTLMVITGDHGMRDSGGHGGSTYNEITVPLIFLNKNCNSSHFHQSDIPVNLANLMGIQIPKTSIGKINRNLFQNLSIEKMLYLQRYNVLNLIQKDSKTCKHFQEASKSHLEFLKNNSIEDGLKAFNLYETCESEISSNLLKTSAKQDTQSLAIAIIVLSILLVQFIRITFGFLNQTVEALETTAIIPILTIQFIFKESPIIQYLFIPTFFLVLISFKFSKYNLGALKFDTILLLLALGTALQPLTFFSSSFVEEEHQYWYFFLTNAVLLLTIRFWPSSVLKALVFVTVLVWFRFLRSLNQTGDKWANLPDITDWLLKSENWLYYRLFALLGICSVFISIRLLMKGFKESLINAIILLLIYQHGASTQTVQIPILGKIIWFLLLIHYCSFKNFIVTWILIISLLLKPFNLLLVSFLCYTSQSIKLKGSDDKLIILHFVLGQALYFAQGHSNSLASVEVSVGYVGLDYYIPVIVFIQVLCHTYAFPVLSNLLVLKQIEIGDRLFEVLVPIRLFTTLIIFIVLFLHRFHLFIWSVFAPKLLIEGVHCLVLYLQFLIYSVYKFISSFRRKQI